MATRLALAVAASLFATAAAGQAEPDVTHDGHWLATIRADGGKPQSARFVLRQFSGDWIGASGRASATGNACAGRKLPITVQASTASALAFTVWGSQGLAELREPDDRGPVRRQRRVRRQGRVGRHDPRDPALRRRSSARAACSSRRHVRVFVAMSSARLTRAASIDGTLIVDPN